MLNLKKVTSNRLLIGWIFSYIIIIVISIIISITVYALCIKVVKENINKIHQASINQIKNNVDIKLKLMNKVSYGIFADDDLVQLSKLDNVDDETDKLAIRELMKSLQTIAASNDLINNIYIQFNKVDKIVSTEALYDTDMFYDLYYKYLDIDYKNWLRGISTRVTDKFIALKANRDNNNKLLFLQALPLNKTSEVNAVIVIEIRNSIIDDIIDEYKLTEGNHIVIKSNKDILFSNLDEGDKGLDQRLELLQSHNNYDVKILQSDVKSWSYISIVSEEILFKDSKYIMVFIIIAVIVSLVLGSLMAGYYSLKNYNPILKIMDIFLDDESIKRGQVIDEYDYIRTSILNVISEKDLINKKIENQKEVFTNNFLVRLLKDGLVDNCSIEDALEMYDIVFDKPYFSVILYYIEDFKLEDSSPDNTNLSNIDEHLIDIVKETTKEYIGDDYACYYVEVDKMLLCMLNFDYEQEEDTKEYLKTAEHNIQKSIEYNFNISIFVALSNFYNNVESINQAYNEVKEVVEYNNYFVSSQKVLHYQDMEINNNNCKAVTATEEFEFINLLKEEKFDEASILFIGLINKYKSSKNYNIHLVKLQIFNLINLLLKSIYEMAYIYGEDMIKGNNALINKIIKCDNIRNLESYLKETVNYFKVFVESYNDNCLSNLKKNIIKCIEDNYQSNNMSVSMIADYLNMNPNYLSKFFKRTMNIGLLDYIHKYRIDKAKMLLIEEQGKNIKDIAEEVGYSTNITFIRAFKKFEGLTPNKYRKHSCSNDNE